MAYGKRIDNLLQKIHKDNERDTMYDEILTLVKDKLPAIQAEALAKHFKEAESTKNALLQTTEQLKMSRGDVDSLKVYNSELQEKVKQNADLDEREKNIAAREKLQDVLECKLMCAQEKVTLAKELFGTVFANAQVKRTIMGNVPVSCPQGGYPQSAAINTEETIESE